MSSKQKLSGSDENGGDGGEEGGGEREGEEWAVRRATQAWLARISAEVEKEEDPEAGGQAREQAAGGANQVPQQVTSNDLQSKTWDEHMDDALNLEADKFVAQSRLINTGGRFRSLPNICRGRADGGVTFQSNGRR